MKGEVNRVLLCRGAGVRIYWGIRGGGWNHSPGEVFCMDSAGRALRAEPTRFELAEFVR